MVNKINYENYKFWINIFKYFSLAKVNLKYLNLVVSLNW